MSSSPTSGKTVSSTGTQPPPSNGGGLGKVWLVAALILVIGVIAGMVPRLKARTALRAESADLNVSYVTVISALPGTNGSALTLPGDIRPLLESPIYARASGYLKKLAVDIGQPVKQGDLLAELDTPELDHELEQARAQLVQAEASLALAKTTADRWQDLFKTSSVSAQETAEKTAALATQAANTEAARAQLRRLEELTGFKRIVAPFDGIVTVRMVDVGVLINAGAGRELFHLSQTQKLRLFVKVPQTYSSLMTTGLEAEVRFSEKPGRTFPAKVVRTAGAIDNDSRTLLTELEVDNSKGEILAGAYAEVRFASAKGQGTLVVPSNTLLFRAEGPQLGIVGDDGVVTLRNVTLGRDFGTTLEIASGVTTNDRVILNPSDSLVSGAIVRIAEAKDKTTK